jgi:hypothetical protein
VASGTPGVNRPLDAALGRMPGLSGGQDYDLALSRYRLLSNQELQRVLRGSSASFLERARALRELERRAALRAATPGWISRN